MKLRHLAGLSALGIMISSPAHAEVGFADAVVDYYDSGAGPIAGPYGGTFPGSFPVSVSLDVVVGSDPGSTVDFLSLPTGSFVTVSFIDEIVNDGVGDDIFITEAGAAGELADIFVTSNFIDYFLLGTAADDGVTSFDLASIGWVGNVAGVRIVGLDALGGSPGFDVVNVRALPGSFTPAVPEPSTWAMLLLGFFGVGGALRRKRNQERFAFS